MRLIGTSPRLRHQSPVCASSSLSRLAFHHTAPPPSISRDTDHRRIDLRCGGRWNAGVKINHLSIRMEPYSFIDGAKQVRVTVVVDGRELHYDHTVKENEFESFYDWLMDEAKREIKKIVLADEKGKP